MKAVVHLLVEIRLVLDVLQVLADDVEATVLSDELVDDFICPVLLVRKQLFLYFFEPRFFFASLS